MSATSKFSFDFLVALRRRAERLAKTEQRSLGPQVNILIREALDARDAKARENSSPEKALADADEILSRTANRG